MTHYIFQVIVFQLLFFIVYLFALKNETFFTYNRIYLLGTATLSFLLPFIRLDIINEQIPASLRVQLPTIFIGDTQPETGMLTEALDPVIISQQTVHLSTILVVVYLIGIAVMMTFFLLKLRKLARLKASGYFIKATGYRLCMLPNTTQAFTFLRTIYLGDTISETEKKHIIAHEKIHIDQYHSIDLLFFELLKIVFWFNPLVYLFQGQLKMLHEFVADYTVAKEDKNSYYQNLLAQVFGTTNITFINTFFNHSLIKKRIIMLQKSKSNRVSTLKYLLIIPFLIGMMVYTSCVSESTDNSTNADLTVEGNTEVMQKITELSEAIMKNGELTDEESNALKLLTTEGQSGDKIYLSVEDYIKDSKEEAVPMAVIENVPTYPGCTGDNAEKKKCFSENIKKYIVNNFDTNVGKASNISGNQKIMVQFKINKIGIIQDVKARAAHPELEREAKRVINQLPKMKAGTQNGESVNVLYSLPIIFKIEQ